MGVIYDREERRRESLMDSGEETETGEFIRNKHTVYTREQIQYKENLQQRRKEIHYKIQHNKKNIRGQ